jgi:hypothetical protein
MNYILILKGEAITIIRQYCLGLNIAEAAGENEIRLPEAGWLLPIGI